MAENRQTGLMIRLDNDELLFFSEEFLAKHHSEIVIDDKDNGAYYGNQEDLRKLKRRLDRDLPVVYGVQNALYVEDLTELPTGVGDSIPDGSRPGKPVPPILDNVASSRIAPTPMELVE